LNLLERVVSAFCRSLPRGGGRVAEWLGACTRGPREVEVGGLPITLDPRSRFERQMLLRCYEHRLVRFATSLLRAGDVAVDAGAHLGWLSIHFAAAVGPEGAVLSVEPVPEHHARLARAAAAARERGRRWTTLEAALGERTGTAELSVGNELNPGFCTIVPGFSRDGLRKAVIRVPVRALDDVLEERGIGAVRLLKVDVEGAEGLVLRGARRALEARRIEHLIVEMSPQAEETQGLERGATARFLRDLGYEGSLLVRGRLRPLPARFDFWAADTYWRRQ
jgi:FkbM family methyltransferase